MKKYIIKYKVITMKKEANVTDLVAYRNLAESLDVNSALTSSRFGGCKAVMRDILRQNCSVVAGFNSPLLQRVVINTVT